MTLFSASGNPFDTIIDGAGVGTVVTCSSGEGRGTILDGFTITGGAGNGGGGMFNFNSSPTVTNCMFIGNESGEMKMKTKTGLKELLATPVCGLIAGILMLVMLGGSVSAQTTWHVDDDNCPGPGTGSVVDPFCSIQDAIDAAVDGDAIEVQPGLYFETINFNGKAVTLFSASGNPFDTIIGGMHPVGWRACTINLVQETRQLIDRTVNVVISDRVRRTAGAVGQGIATPGIGVVIGTIEQ